MAVDLTSLYKQRNAINQQIEEAQKQARENGEVIVIDGKEYNAVWDFEGMLPNPVDSDLFPTYRKDENGDITDSGEISYSELISRFGGKVTDAEAEALANIQQAVTNFNQIVQEAIEHIQGLDNTGYTCTIGDGTTTTFTITHNLGTQKYLFQPWSKLDDYSLDAWSIKTIDANTAEITFESPPPADGVDLYFAPISMYGDINGIPFENIKDVLITPEQIDPSCMMSKEDALAILNGTSD